MILNFQNVLKYKNYEIYYASVLRSNSHLKIPKNCNPEFDFHSLYLEPVRTRL